MLLNRNFKIGLALAVLAAGLGLAMLFPREDPARAGTEADPSEEKLTLRDSSRPTVAQPVYVETQEHSPATGESDTASVAPSPRVPTAVAARDDDQPPPKLPATYDQTMANVTKPLARQDPSASRLSSSASPAAAANRTTRTHKVADGDTLAWLAQRYLKDKHRYLDIYEANRDVISDPNILPIGTVLKIPLLRAGDQANNAPQEKMRLVPIPPGRFRHRGT